MNDLVLINHNTLTIEHVELCIYSISNKNQTNEIEWNSIYIYNSCDYITNDSIKQLIKTYNIKYNNIIELNTSITKTLNSDLLSIANQCKTDNNILLLKCDYSLSKNFNSVMLEYSNNTNFVYSLPVINAKELVSDDEIKTLIIEDKFIICDQQTYYRGSDLYEPRHECGSTIYTDVDEPIRFVSWGGSLDYNVHYMSNNTLEFFIYSDPNLGWGRCMAFDLMRNTGISIINDKNTFCVHKYHYTNERTDPRKIIMGQRY